MIKERPLFQGMTATLNTTESCNLSCTYCYEINKKSKHLSLDTAKAFIDLLLSSEDPINVKGTPNEWILDSGIILDFIGGDSLMNPELLDEILSYFQFKLWDTNHRAKDNWRASISTNGTLFVRPEVRKFCEKWRATLSLGVSIDGSPSIHDKYRVFPDGSPTSPIIQESWPWFKSLFPEDSLSTKATASKATIPFLYDSLVYMHETLGLRWISQNFIMEDMNLTSSDLEELDRQLEKSVYYLLEHKDDLFWSMLRREFTEAKRSEGSDWTSMGTCGSGSMLALSIDGNIYPCFRWLPHSQPDERKKMIAGTVSDGFNNKSIFDEVRTGAYRQTCSRDPKCAVCEYESACPYCIAGCYAETGEFKRQTYICEVIKLQVKWAKIYWKKLEELQ